MLKYHMDPQMYQFISTVAEADSEGNRVWITGRTSWLTIKAVKMGENNTYFNWRYNRLISTTLKSYST